MKIMNENILVSVVIPVYNVERYLNRCVDSVINQTYKNLEIILVDDGSTDNCGNICDQYLTCDDRIKVIHKKNGGLSDARNYGLDVAHGDYICFIDSDDFISNYYVEKMINAAIKNNSDICACNFKYIDEFGKEWIREEKKEKVYSPEEAIRDIFTAFQHTEVMVWNKIYKRNLFADNRIKFPVGKIHEDNFTTYKLYDKANSISLINDKLYYYLQRSDSIMGRVFNEKRFDILLALDEIKKYFKKSKKYSKEIECNELLVNLSLLSNMIRADYDKNKQIEIRNKILKNKKSYLKNRLIPFQKKVMIIVLFINLTLYSKLLLMLKR